MAGPRSRNALVSETYAGDADMMQNTRGSGAHAITGTLAKSLGFDIGPLMKLAPRLSAAC